MSRQTIKYTLGAIAVTIAAVGAAAAYADGSHGHASHARSSQAQGAAPDFVEGEVRKVDKDNKKITLKHGPIKNLDMPGMTMVFNVDDVKVLDTVQTGDKVQFKATNEAGKFTVTELQAVK